jgi:outer membrane protein
MSLINRLITRILLSLCGPLLAMEGFACEQGYDECVAVGEWEISLGLGMGVRTNPVEDTPDIPLVLIPQVNYNGEHFFIQNLDFGFILRESETQQLNVLVTPSYDQVYFHRWSPSNFFLDSNRLALSGNSGGKDEDENLPVINPGDKEFIGPSFNDLHQRELRNRRMAGMAGFEYRFTLDELDLQAQYLSDFTGIHEGEEARISLAKHWASGRHHLITSVGVVWQSSEVVNYYYGVTQAEADARGAYATDAAVSSIARLDWNYQLTERWDLRLLASYRQLPNEISATPLINDNKVITVFVGGVYHF